VQSRIKKLKRGAKRAGDAVGDAAKDTRDAARAVTDTVLEGHNQLGW
jgi:hypothetical protein